MIHRALPIASTFLLLAACSGSAKPASESASKPAEVTDRPAVKPSRAPSKCDPKAPVLAEAWSTRINGVDAAPRGTGGHLVTVRKGGHYTIQRAGKTRQGCLTSAQQSDLASVIAQVPTGKQPTAPKRRPVCKAEAMFHNGVGLHGAGAAEWALCQSHPPSNGLLDVANWLNKLSIAPTATTRTATGSLACGPTLQCQGGAQVCLWRVNDIAGGPQDYSCANGFTRCGQTDCACALAQHKRTNPNEYVTCRTNPNGIMLIRPGG